MDESKPKYYSNLSEIPIAHYFCGVLQGKFQYLHKLDYYDIDILMNIPENFEKVAENMLCEIPKLDFTILELRKNALVNEFNYSVTGKDHYLNRQKYYETNLLKELNKLEQKELTIVDLLRWAMNTGLILETKINIFKEPAINYYLYNENLEIKAKAAKKSN